MDESSLLQALYTSPRSDKVSVPLQYAEELIQQRFDYKTRASEAENREHGSHGETLELRRRVRELELDVEMERALRRKVEVKLEKVQSAAEESAKRQSRAVVSEKDLERVESWLKEKVKESSEWEMRCREMEDELRELKIERKRLIEIVRKRESQILDVEKELAQTVLLSDSQLEKSASAPMNTMDDVVERVGARIQMLRVVVQRVERSVRGLEKPSLPVDAATMIFEVETASSQRTIMEKENTELKCVMERSDEEIAHFRERMKGIKKLEQQVEYRKRLLKEAMKFLSKEQLLAFSEAVKDENRSTDSSVVGSIVAYAGHRRNSSGSGKSVP